MADSDEPNPIDERDEPSSETDSDPLVDIAARLAELKTFAAHLAEVKVDQARLWTKQALVAIVVWGFVSLAAVVVVSVSVLYIARGAALGFSALFGNRPWIGYLLAGTLLLTLFALGGTALYVIQSNRRRKEIIEKYEARRDHQEAGLGFTVDDAAATGSRRDDRRDPETGIQSCEQRDAGVDATNP